MASSDRQFLSLVFLLCSSCAVGLGVYGLDNNHPGPSALILGMAVFFFGVHLMMLRPREEKRGLTQPKEEKSDVSQPDKRPDDGKESKTVKRKTSPRRKPKITTNSPGE